LFSFERRFVAPPTAMQVLLGYRVFLPWLILLAAILAVQISAQMLSPSSGLNSIV
jgi:hypothetical protein